jgi:NADH:ubiquinone reductase (H+-translocating)
MSSRNAAPPTVVIVGGGFGGLTAARALANAPVRVVMVDRSNHHLFQPLLYQVATAALSPGDIAAPIRRVLRNQKNAEVQLAEVESIDAPGKVVVLKDGAIRYDYLILATGATHSYFGRDEWEPFAPGLKSISDALEIRRRFLSAFEIAERETDDDVRRAWMTFVIVGAGPTGVELAGTLSEVARDTLARDFRHIDPRQARVILIEGAPHVLPAFGDPLSGKARDQLKALGVDVRTSQMVTSIDEAGVSLGDERIAAKTVLWAAGVAGSPVGATLGAPLDRAGRVCVSPALTVSGRDEIYVVGDLAHLEQDGKLVPGVAPAAIQMGKYAARHIVDRLQNRVSPPFHYVDKGSLATIGRAAAVADIRGWRVSGFVAWLLWLFVHILFLIGFRNRFVVLIQWAWSFITFDRGARLITGKARDEESAPDAVAKRGHP